MRRLLRSRSRSAARDDRGTLMLLGSVMMVALLGFSALAVDVANARQNHRQLQNAADSAALAAGQDLPHMVTAIQTVKDYAERNYDVPVSDWNGCRDSERLALTPDVLHDNQCISFPADRSRVRVNLPNQTVDTFFGSVFGHDSLGFRADATAGAVVARADRIIPAAVTGPMGTGLLCIEQAGNNQDCANRERGQFGSLNSPRLNMFRPSSNVTQTAQAINYAMNLDHSIEEFEAFPQVCDGGIVAPCVSTNEGTNLVANHVVTTTGNDVPPVTEGYVTGFMAQTEDQGNVTFCGRLERPDFSAENLLEPKPDNCQNPGQPTIDMLGHTVNGRHIYYWLTDEARKLFYPEAWALTEKGVADTDPSMVLSNSGLWAAGDARLDCFLAGYRYDVSTAVETLPDCTGVDLTLPSSGPTWTRTYGAVFNGGYNENDGTETWLDPTWQEFNDDNFFNRGIIHFSKPAGAQRFFIQAGQCCASMKQHIDLSGGNTAKVSVDLAAVQGVDGKLAVEATLDGVNYIRLGELDTQSAPGVHTFDMSQFAGEHYVGIRIAVAEGPVLGDTTFDLDSFFVEYSHVPAPATIAPIFEPDFNTDTRWAVIPRVGPYDTHNAKPIEGFWGFFGYTSYTTSTKVQAFDAWVFDPALMVNDPSGDSFFYGFSPEPVVRLTQ